MLSRLLFLPRNTAIAMLKVYRLVVSPIYGNVCRYYPSCSAYALAAYQNRSFFVATALVVWRLIRCNPVTEGGIDDVPISRQGGSIISEQGYVLKSKTERQNNLNG